ncbi:MAG: hypothetical protein NVSMB13_16820 [Mycobacteriales bacterium]
MALLTEQERDRRQRERDRRDAAREARRRLASAPVAAPSQTVWSAAQLPSPRSASVGVPFSEGLTSVFIGAIAYLPVGLVTGYSVWNYPVAAVLVLALSYAICSRRVVVGPGFVAVRKFGPYRVASADSVTSGALVDSQRGGVLKLRTGDGRTMRLRRIEFTRPEVNAALRSFVLTSGRRYDENVMALLDLPWREDFGHHRYLLDAVQ